MKAERIKEIRNYIRVNKTITLDRICNQFDISKRTLQRDLDEIIKNGDIKKIYGGVTFLAKKERSSFEERYISRQSIKIAIATAAAALIEDGDIIFIDAGTTTAHVIDHMTNKKNITILTNNIEILKRAILYDNIEVIVLPGILNRKTKSFIGSSAIRFLQDFNIIKALIATTGFSITSGLTCSSPLEADLKRIAIQRSKEVYLLADSSKCGVVALNSYCSLSSINTLITEGNLPTAILENITENGNSIYLVK